MAEMLDFEEFKRRYQEVPVEEYPNRVQEAVPDPLLTVLLTTYNHADYIRKAIESVLMQEVDFPMEIVLGDDDSSDGTREICIEYAEQHPDLIRLQLHHRENNHRLYGRPTHLFQYWYNTLSARGKYIAPLSGDDYWTVSGKLQKQVSLLEQNTNYCFTHHNAKLKEKDGKKSKYFSVKRDEKLSPKKLRGAPIVVASSAVFKNVFHSIPSEFMETIHEDRIVTSTLGRHGKGKFLSDIMSVYRKHGEGLFDTLSNRNVYLDKNKYLSIISNKICESRQCKRSILKEKVNVSKEMLLKSLSEGQHVLSAKIITETMFLLVLKIEIKKALGWFKTVTKYVFRNIV
ncbi:glycosyltransferase family 2 protein [Salinibacter ruber]|uniref:glycosyltransferase family 2 protein n=1 Tax=Salinibacter ruber TaxID=146919 RepID=UPI002168A68F|nr:glycosyltransferase [Salinibacter ruber]MCS4101412.1 glycosyltransferase involved in cell wall biosynthesis [Salinibacter ruber]